MRIAVVRAGDGGPPRIELDRAGDRPGRGAYLCRDASSGEPDGSCAALARRRGGIARALRCPISDGAVVIDPKLIESMGHEQAPRV
jgi:predicted RNA-binding protein YlxR (DUF448 family)